MSAAELELAQLLASRICHDLISPVAAVNNGLELLEEDDEGGEMRERALELVMDSARVAAAKLQIMRSAFGAGQTLPEQSSQSDLWELLKPISEKNNISFEWNNLQREYFTRNESRLLLNMLLLACEALPRGGKISIQAEEKGFCLSLTGSKVIFPQDKEDFLCDSKEKPTEPRFIGLYLVRLLAEQVGDGMISLMRGEANMKMIVT
ncbi:MAG: histidine phosphotransferase family protein [Pseudomonadota bacterium]